MTIIEILAKTEHYLRPYLTKLRPDIVTAIYSFGRKKFLKSLVNNLPKKRFLPSISHRIKLWDKTFACPIFNAAGMFKDGNGYYFSAYQGAGAFLAGTTTEENKPGNYKNGIWHPFIPYPNSKSASNWLGLPNPGHSTVAKILSNIEKIPHCPIGASLSASPDKDEKKALDELIEGLYLYEKANVDFIEINESCPNVPHNQSNSYFLDENLVNRLEYISQKFLKKRTKNLPVIIKLSTDLNIELVHNILDIALKLDFDGINFGNTSTNYENLKGYIANQDLKKFEYFTRTFGGGVSGKPLKNKSFALCKKANEIIQSMDLSKEFNIIRTGGVENYDDVLESKKIGIQLNQWFTAYFDFFANYGHKLYIEFFK